MDTNDQTKYFVDENETIYTSYNQNINNTENENYEFELIITNKNIYANTRYENKVEQNIIDLQTVEFVKYANTQIKQNHNGLLTFGFLLLIGGLIMGCMLIPQADNYSALIITGFALAIAGLIITIIALIISRPKNIIKLVIGTSGEPIEIISNEINPNEIKKLQKDIFKAKNNL